MRASTILLLETKRGCIFSQFPVKIKIKFGLKKMKTGQQLCGLHEIQKNGCFAFFFSVNGVVAQIVVPEGQTVTGELYTNQILPSVFQKYKEIRGRTTVRDVMLH